MRGKKGTPHHDPADPPRVRGNTVRGHGNWDNDRPPVLGIVGRETGEVRLEVVRTNSAAELLPRVLDATDEGAAVNSDDWGAYPRLNDLGRGQAGVCHSRREWARDDDGDGIREVHNNTMEGTWTGLRIYLAPFRGVSKWFLSQYVAMYAWCCNTSEGLENFLRAMLGTPISRYRS